MDLHLPAVARYTSETRQEQEARDTEVAAGPISPWSPNTPLRAKPVSDITMALSERLKTTGVPAPLPKAIEAYYVGPASRGYTPVDADVRYTVPIFKPPPAVHQRTGAPDASAEVDPNGTHSVKAVPPGRPPLALGPPLHSTVQTGQVAASVATPGGLLPLDWSYLFNFSATTPPALQITPGPASFSATAASTGSRGKRAGVGIRIGGSGDTGLTPGKAGALTPLRGGWEGLGGSSVQAPSVSGSVAGSLAPSLASRRTAATSTAAALPQTEEGKFCAGIAGVMERLAATQSAQTGRYRSLRMQAAEQRDAVVSTVVMPPPPQTGAFSTRAAASRMASVLERSGASRDDLQAIVRQIPQFKGLSDDLRTAVAERFQLFCYPPGSYLYEQNCRCDEAFVLFSGAAMLHVEGRPPQRLQPGTVLGVDLMLRRQAVPLSITTDPHFEAQLAVLSWGAYEDAVRRWATDKVITLMPELQASQVARLESGLMRGMAYRQCQPGESLYVGGAPADHVALLVQGQVLVAGPCETDALVTQGQMVSQLRVMIGPLASSMVLNELPKQPAAARGGLRGSLKSLGGMRGSEQRLSDLGVVRSSVTAVASGAPAAAVASTPTGPTEASPKVSAVVPRRSSLTGYRKGSTGGEGADALATRLAAAAVDGVTRRLAFGGGEAATPTSVPVSVTSTASGEGVAGDKEGATPSAAVDQPRGAKATALEGAAGGGASAEQTPRSSKKSLRIWEEPATDAAPSGAGGKDRSDDASTSDAQALRGTGNSSASGSVRMAENSAEQTPRSSKKSLRIWEEPATDAAPSAAAGKDGLEDAGTSDAQALRGTGNGSGNGSVKMAENSFRPGSGHQQQRVRSGGSSSSRNSRKGTGTGTGGAEASDQAAGDSTREAAAATGDGAKRTRSGDGSASEAVNESVAAAASRAARVSIRFAGDDEEEQALPDAAAPMGEPQPSSAAAVDMEVSELMVPTATDDEAGGGASVGAGWKASATAAAAEAGEASVPPRPPSSGRGSTAVGSETSLLPAISAADLAGQSSGTDSPTPEGPAEPVTPTKAAATDEGALAAEPSVATPLPGVQPEGSFAFTQNADGSSGDAGASGDSPTLTFSTVASVATEASGVEASAASTDLPVASGSGEDLAPEASGTGPAPSPNATPGRPPLPHKGLRSKIGGEPASPPGSTVSSTRRASPISPVASRGGSRRVSSSGASPSGSIKMLAAPGARWSGAGASPNGEGGSRANSATGPDVAAKPLLQSPSTSTSIAGGTESGRADGSKVLSAASSLRTKGSLRPSTPGSEAPSVDERLPGSATFRQHPLLPPSPSPPTTPLDPEGGTAPATGNQQAPPEAQLKHVGSTQEAGATGNDDVTQANTGDASADADGAAAANASPAATRGGADTTPGRGEAASAGVLAEAGNGARDNATAPAASAAASSRQSTGTGSAQAGSRNGTGTGAPLAEASLTPVSAVAGAELRPRTGTGDADSVASEEVISSTLATGSGGITTEPGGEATPEQARPRLRIRLASGGGSGPATNDTNMTEPDSAAGGSASGEAGDGSGKKLGARLRLSDVSEGRPAAAAGGRPSLGPLSDVGRFARSSLHASGMGGGGSLGGTSGSGAAQPLANALAAQLKLHRQRLVAVYGGPVVFCEEALSEVAEVEGKKKAPRPPAAHSAVALTRCEFLLIPAALLRALLPPGQLPRLAAAAVAAQRRLVAASGHQPDSSPVVWPAAAERIREVLSSAPPGQRQPWQVELLASAFSHLPAFARLTWQVRLRIFQDLEYRKLEPGSHLDLAKLEVTEVKQRPLFSSASQSPVGSSHTAGGSSRGPSPSPSDRNAAQPSSGTVSPDVAQEASGGISGAPPAEDGSESGARAPIAKDFSGESLRSRSSDASSAPSKGELSTTANANGEGSATGEPLSALEGFLVTANEQETADAGADLLSNAQTRSLRDVGMLSAEPTKTSVGSTHSERVSPVAVSSAEMRASSLKSEASGNAAPGKQPSAGVLGPIAEELGGEASGPSAAAAPAEQGSAVFKVPNEASAQASPFTAGASGGGVPTVESSGAAASDPATSASGEDAATAAANGDAALQARKPSWLQRYGSRNGSRQGSRALQSVDGRPSAPGTAVPALLIGKGQSGSLSGEASGDAGTSPRRRPWAERYGSKGSGSQQASPREGQATDAAVAPSEEQALPPSAEVAREGSGQVPQAAGPAKEASQASQASQASVHSLHAALAAVGSSASVGAADAGGVAGPGVAPASKRGRQPHTVEALFNPAAEEPLIPSLALHRREPSAMDVAPPSFSVSEIAAAMQAPAQASQAPLLVTPSPAPELSLWAGSDGVDARAALASAAAGSAAGSAATTGKNTPEPVLMRLDTTETYQSEAPSHSYVGSSRAGSPGIPYEGTRHGPDGDASSQGAPTGPTPDPLMTPSEMASTPPPQDGTISPSPTHTESSLRTPSPPPPPPKREAAAHRLDDRAYWCLSGAISLEALLQPPEPEAQGSDSSEPTPEASSSSFQPSSGNSGSPTPEYPMRRGQDEDEDEEPAPEPQPQPLQVARPGDTFSSAALTETILGAFSAQRHRLTPRPHGTEHGSSEQQAPSASAAADASDLPSKLPVGRSVLRARAAGEAPAEVLCMSKPMYELLANGVGRSVQPAALPVLARHVDWLAGLDMQVLASDLAGRYRLEEHKQGTELLRAGEPAPVVFLVASGECIMRGPVVGLRDPTSVPEAMDLATLREGATCGELSLLASRPLWYTLVVSSPVAKVVSLDLSALRAWLLTSPHGQAAAADVVAAVAEIDIALYGRAVKHIAVQVLCEKLELSLFTPPMKTILRRVMEDNASELTAIMHHQHLQQGQTGAKDGSPNTSGGGSTLKGLPPPTIVMEEWNKVQEIASSMARPYNPGAQPWEVLAKEEYSASHRSGQSYLGALFTAGSLATEEDAGGHASGGQRIAMPAPGPVAAGLAAPTPARQPKMYDIRTVPKDLRGSEVESSRLHWDTSYLPTHELAAMMGAKVHVLRSAARQLLGRDQPWPASGPAAQSHAAAVDALGESLGGQPPSGTGGGAPGASRILLKRRAEDAVGSGGGGGGAGAAPEGRHSSTGRASVARRAMNRTGSLSPRRGPSPLIAAAEAATSGADTPNGDGASGTGADSSTRPRLRIVAPRVDYRSNAPATPLSPDEEPPPPWESWNQMSPTWGLAAAAAVGEDGTAGTSNKSMGPSSSAWSLAPLEGHRGRPVVQLSAEPSAVSAALDPELRARLDREMMEELGQEYGSAGDVTGGAEGAGGGSGSESNPSGSPTSGSGQPRSLLAPAGVPLAQTYPGPLLARGRNQKGAGLGAASPLGVIMEDGHEGAAGPADAAAAGSRATSRSVDSRASSAPSSSAAGGVLPPPAKALPPLHLPHNSVEARPVPVPGPGAAWPSRLATTDGDAAYQAPGGGAPSAGTPPAVAAPRSRMARTSGGAGGNGGGGIAANASASSLDSHSAAVLSAASCRRSRIAARSAAANADPTEAPDRAFWVRNRLHDPQGLAEGVLADAAANAVGSTLASVGAPRPGSPVRAVAALSASVPGPSTGGGRAGRLQPLRRNSSGTPASAALATAALGTPREHSGAAAGGTAAGAAAAAAPVEALAEAGMLYVTMELPPAPKLLPEFHSPAAAREAAEAVSAAERAAREARIAAAIAHPSTRPLAVRHDMRYVPQYLRQRQRDPVIPQPARPLPEAESDSWVVPSYNSDIGFKDGFYDENSQVIYFD